MQEMVQLVGKALAAGYVAQKLLGEGAFGAVFKCTQSFCGRPVRPVALKLSKKTGFTERDALSLFADGILLAESMGKITDVSARSHLVHVYDMGLLRELDNRAYMVME